MDNKTVFRPRANLIWGACAIVLDVLFLVQVVFYPTKDDQLWLGVLLCLVFGLAAYALWLRPKLVLGDDSLIIVNPISTTAIAYRDIVELETKWALLIRHGQQATRVWVAPTNGKQRWVTDTTGRWTFNKLPRTDVAVGAGAPASASMGSDSGIAAELIKQRLQRLH